jgi:hypothetical protein
MVSWKPPCRRVKVKHDFFFGRGMNHRTWAEDPSRELSQSQRLAMTDLASDGSIASSRCCILGNLMRGYRATACARVRGPAELKKKVTCSATSWRRQTTAVRRTTDVTRTHASHGLVTRRVEGIHNDRSTPPSKMEQGLRCGFTALNLKRREEKVPRTRVYIPWFTFFHASPGYSMQLA